jgi:hypothetical protein
MTPAGGLPCPVAMPDSDGDLLSDAVEGVTDTDNDGTPDFRDLDSDNDGIPDSIEGRNFNTCTPPADEDGDGKPDFRDLDSDSADDSTIPDREEVGPDPIVPLDSDQDGIPDFADRDNDNDGISDAIELAAPGIKAKTRADAPDTDQDGTPDFLDSDSDGDTVEDQHEGPADTDKDGTPNFRDLDADGDCLPDSIEAGDADPKTIPVDTDQDLAADFVDRDSDNDGVLDDFEDLSCNGVIDACETDRLKGDSDGDGVTDLIERAACRVKTLAQQATCKCDGADAAASPLTRGDFVFVVDYMQPPAPLKATLDLATDVAQADIVFAVDTTFSMQQAIVNLRTNLGSFVNKVKMSVKSPAFGVVEFRDFGDTPLVAYQHRIETVDTPPGVGSVQGVLNTLTAAGGGDFPEAGWQALYAIAGGLSINFNGYNSVFSLTNTYPIVPVGGESQGTLHGAGFRAGSVPIVVTVTDAHWHDAYGSLVGTDAESGIDSFTDPTFSAVPSRRATIDRLNAIGAKVVGISGHGGGAQPGADPKARARAVAIETGAVVLPADFGPMGSRPIGCALTQCCTGDNGAGEPPVAGECPLSFSFDGSSGNGVSDAAVTGLAALGNSLKFDLHVQARDVDPMTVDRFISNMLPNLSGAGPASVCITSAPTPLRDELTGPTALPGPDGTLDTYPQIPGGKRVCYDVVPKINTTVMRAPDPQVFRAQLQVRGASPGGIVNLGAPREVFFLVPPAIVNGPLQ